MICGTIPTLLHKYIYIILVSIRVFLPLPSPEILPSFFYPLPSLYYLSLNPNSPRGMNGAGDVLRRRAYSDWA